MSDKLDCNVHTCFETFVDNILGFESSKTLMRSVFYGSLSTTSIFHDILVNTETFLEKDHKPKDVM